jgi:vacuolar iron transporter family protein
MTHHPIIKIEPHINSGQKLNWLRAGVLGANDGIVSTAALVVGVAGASNSPTHILTAGVAGLVAGAISMGVGEYVSVSTQRDTENALIEKEKREHNEDPEFELKELAQIYESKGLSAHTAKQVAGELTEFGALDAHLEAELGISADNLTDPWRAAFASALAFICGAIIPLTMIIVPPANLKIPVTFLGVIVALIITGAVSAYIGESSKRRASIRLVLGGLFAMAVTFGIGSLFGSLGV